MFSLLIQDRSGAILFIPESVSLKNLHLKPAIVLWILISPLFKVFKQMIIVRNTSSDGSQDNKYD